MVGPHRGVEIRVVPHPRAKIAGNKGGEELVPPFGVVFEVVPPRGEGSFLLLEPKSWGTKVGRLVPPFGVVFEVVPPRGVEIEGIRVVPPPGANIAGNKGGRARPPFGVVFEVVPPRGEGSSLLLEPKSWGTKVGGLVPPFGVVFEVVPPPGAEIEGNRGGGGVLRHRFCEE